MNHHHRYKIRDFDFSQQLVTLRQKAGLIQKEVASGVGLAEKSIRNWEGGSNYPTTINLRKLIAFYLDHHAFTPGNEQDEVRLLWDQLHKRNPLRTGKFDEQWFAALLQEWQALAGNQQPEQQGFPLSRPAARLLRGDWSEALDVSSWYGRSGELTELEHWLLTEQCRLVTVLGMGGIGKTALAVKLVQQVASHFECVLWCSLYNAPPLDDVLRDWLPILLEQRTTPQPQGVEQSLALLIGLLQERRCLLVLDNLETLFPSGVLEGHYREGCEGYADLIRHVAETSHQSCLLLTSRELPPGLEIFTGQRAPVRVFKLGSLALTACQQLLQDKEIFGEQAAWSELVQRCSGNPLVLKIVAETVRELFGGDIAAFLAENLMTFHSIRQLLDQQFERLSAQEQTLLYWLAIEREQVPLKTLEADLWQASPSNEVLDALHSLRSRSLVERGERGAVFMLQPVILEYVSERLVRQVSKEIREGEPALLRSHALVRAQAKDYIRSSQAQLLLRPVLDRLLAHFGNRAGLEGQLDGLLAPLRTQLPAAQGYVAGNVVNLLVRLNGHLKGKDCSHLTVWQAALQGAEAQDASFAGADLTDSVFLETLDAIVSVASSATGQYVASGSFNGEIRLWRATDGRPLLAFRGHSRLAWSLAFHPEGILLASGGHEGLVKVWEVSSGQCVRILQGHSKWVKSVAFHPAGKLLATCSDDRSIRLWDLTDGSCIKIWQKQSSEVWSVAFSPDGLLLASGQADGLVEVWDLTSQQYLWSVRAHRRMSVTSLAFSPDGELLVSGGYDTTIMVWRASNGELVSTLSGHTDVINSVTFNAEGLLASGSFDRTVKLWQVGAGGEAAHCVDTLQGHTGWVWSTAFGPDGLLVSGSDEGVMKLWQINEGGESGKCLRTLQGYSRMITVIAFTPDGKLLISGENNRTMRVWKITNGQCLRILSRQTGDSFAVAFCPDGRLFAQASSDDNTIKLWEMASGRCLMTLKGHQEINWSLAFSLDGHLLFSSGLDKTIRCWEVETGQCLSTLEGHHNWVWALACSPDGRLLASGDSDGVVKLWEITSRRCLRTLHGSPKAVVALTFTPDGQTLLSSNAQDIVSMWNVQNGHCLRTIPGIGDAYWPGSVAFNADGSLLAAASNDRTVKVWDVSKGLFLQTLPSHTGWPRSVAFADQHMLASGTDEGTIQIWNVQTGEHLMTLQSERPYEHMDITGVTGLTQAQIASLTTLGAIDKEIHSL